MSKKKKKEKKLDEFHYHEALDRTDMLLDIIEDHLRQHPVIKNHKQLKVRVEVAQDVLDEVYQRISALDFEKFPLEEVVDNK